MDFSWGQNTPYFSWDFDYRYPKFIVYSNFSWTMRLSLCEAPTRETRPDHNTGNYVN